ncbi:MAG: MFS family permease [Verrucomicrobiales bacterium]|jgi:MFS family permease
MGDPDRHPSAARKAFAMLALTAAGESIFFLPFIIARVFRPTFLDVFGLTNLQLGACFSAYGVVAMIAYFPGGPLADRFEARKLMAVALVATALGGLLFVSLPALATLKLLYGFWGLTTILLFWAAMIRATREWGRDSTQGLAFGLLDGGRGLMTAVMGSVSVAVFAFLLPSDIDSATAEQKATAFQQIIWGFGFVVLTVAIFVWFALPRHASESGKKREEMSLEGVRRVLAMPTVWLQALILVCAYVGFQGTNDFSLLARDALDLNEVEAAGAGTISLWTRPVAAILAGVLADRFGAIRMTFVSFGLLLLGSSAIAAGVLAPGKMALFFFVVVTASAGIFALRGLYYAIMQDGKVPLVYTGSAVGVISVIGYTPDVFMGPVTGWLLDRSPGELGHQHLFATVAAFALLGILATWLFRHCSRLG